MSQHVQRAKRDYTLLYIALIGPFILLCLKFYEKPRTATFEVTPNTANIYYAGKLVCERSPCTVELGFWPDKVRVQERGYHPRNIQLLNAAHFLEGTQSFKLTLRPLVKWPPQRTRPVLPPRKTPDARRKPTPDDQAPLQTKPKTKAPKARTAPQIPKAAVRKQAGLPFECQELLEEQRRAGTRRPILCHYEDLKSIGPTQSGYCYAYYWVTKDGDVEKGHSYDCVHKDLIDQAKSLFSRRKYLPPLRRGRPTREIVMGYIEYGDGKQLHDRKPGQLYINDPDADYTLPSVAYKSAPPSAATVNRDAEIISCPPAERDRRLRRSAYCTFEFDLSVSGKLTQIRRAECTDRLAYSAARAALLNCSFKAAVTDGSPIARPYMKHQINIDVYGPNGQRLPLSAAFSDRAEYKPYIVIESPP